MKRREFVGLMAAGSAAMAMPGVGLAQDAAVDPSLVKDMILGDPNAPVKLTEYAWYTCPHCANFHATVWPQLKRDYIDTGKASFEYREVFWGDHRTSLWPSIVARCGDSTERFFGVVDIVFEKQREWTQAETAAQLYENLRKIGKTAGLTDAMLDACFQDQAKAQAVYTIGNQRVKEDKVDSTPTFFIDGKEFTGSSWTDMFAEIDAKIAG